jgi:Toprim domain-containing protein
MRLTDGEGIRSRASPTEPRFEAHAVMSSPAAELARRLARDAEAVCRHYLSNGRRQGRYWTVGDIHNTPGRSLYLRLSGPDSGPGAAGKWTDAATGEHGDLLDLIALNCGLARLRDVLDEARAFLALPQPEPARAAHKRSAPIGSPEAARRLFRAGRTIVGTPAAAYLRARGITGRLIWPSLRYHPSVYYRAHEDAPRETWPALLAAVTDRDDRITGVHRTWLDQAASGKAPFADPRRALGHLLGNGVRFGGPREVLAAGEGIETVLALQSVLPSLPMVAALSANHLAALDLPPTLRRLYVARDNDAAGLGAAGRLHARGAAMGIDVRDLVPVFADFNLDLWHLGPAAMLGRLIGQLVPDDAVRFAPDEERSDFRRLA